MAFKISGKFFRKIEAKKIAKKIFQRKTPRRIFIAFSLLIIFLAVAFFVFNLVYQGRVLPHTYIGGYNFGGLSQEESKAQLSEIIQKSKGSQLNYSWENDSYMATLDELKVDYTAEQDQTVN